MILDKKLVVIMPAYNAEKTLRQTYQDLPHDYVDEVILVDDASRDDTSQIARELGITTVIHMENKGYGGNQKTCYTKALQSGADIVVMVHPDYQYSPRLVTAMASMIASGHYDVVLGSRILGGGALKGGMPLYKYVANRLLTFAENLVLGVKLSEYHTDSAHSPGSCSKHCRLKKIPTISFLTARCSSRRYTSASGSGS